MPWLELRTVQWSAHRTLLAPDGNGNQEEENKIKANTFHVTGLAWHLTCTPTHRLATASPNKKHDFRFTNNLRFFCLLPLKLTRRTRGTLFRAYGNSSFKSFQQINNSCFPSVSPRNRKSFPEFFNHPLWGDLVRRKHFQMNALIAVGTTPLIYSFIFSAPLAFRFT